MKTRFHFESRDYANAYHLEDMRSLVFKMIALALFVGIPQLPGCWQRILFYRTSEGGDE